MAQTIIEKEGDKLLIKPQERLDTVSAPKFHEEIIPYMDEAKDVVIDFERVEYISSAGLRVLLTIYQDMEDKGGSLKLTNVSSSIMAVFDLVNFSEIVTIE